MDGPGTGWRFSRAFWVANGVELLERAAWYGVFVAITLYLSRILGFSDIEAAAVSGIFSAGLYLLPTFSGAYADRIGFRNALMLAFGLLTLGYGSMWLLPTLLARGRRGSTLASATSTPSSPASWASGCPASC